MAACVLLIGASFAYDDEFLKAHQWMVDNGMTKHAVVDAFQPEAFVTREQAAKFFVEFDRVVMGRDAETMMYCVYTDETNFDSTLAGSIQSACNRNLMRGANGTFDPQGYLTKAQALAILIRSLQGTQDETTTPRRSNYFTIAKELNMTKETQVLAVDKPLTRYELALLLWRVENPLMVASSDEQDLEEIYGLLSELGLQAE